jgi:YegS/Rv2252/BmrU family lipid kinase
MKNIFIINPIAGKKNVTKFVTESLEKYTDKLEYEIYVTKGIGDATNFVRNYCENNNEEIRFYSCGGDGTLNEVINGAINYPNVSIACFPSGSGNDFIKVFGKRDDFLNIDNLINGHVTPVDVIKMNDKYTINICNFGLDAVIGEKMTLFKNKPFVSGKGAYVLSLIYNFFGKMRYECTVKVDGELFHDGRMLLCALANGICYGGGYYCAPIAKVDDGLIDICLVKKVSRIKFISLLGVYKKGKHLEDKRLQKIIKYTKGKNIEITSNADLAYTLDGEIGRAKIFSVSIIEKAINFVIPII